MLDDSTKQGESFAAKLSEKVADKLVGLRDVSHAVATALGLNLEHIAENIARVLTGMTKSEEEAFKKAEELSDRLTEMTIQQGRARLSDEDKLASFLQERGQLEKQIATHIANATAEWQKQKDAIDDAVAAGAIVIGQQKTMVLSGEQLTKLKDLETKLTKTTGEIETINAAAKKEQAANYKKTLEDERVVSERAHAEEEKGYLDRADSIQKIAKAKADALPIDRQIYAMEADIRNLTTAIWTNKKLGLDTTALEVKKIEDIGALTKLRGDAEKERSKTEKDIAVTLAEQADQAERAAKAAKAHADFMQTINRVGTSYDQQSTAALQGVANRLNEQLRASSSGGGQLKDVTFHDNASEFLSASMFRLELSKVMDELNLRSNVVSYDKRFGEQATLAQFGDSVTQRSIRDMQTATEQTAASVNSITQMLSASGLFPPVQAGGTVRTFG